MGYVIGECPFLGDYDFCSRKGKNCKDGDCLLHKVVSDCEHFKSPLSNILFITLNVVEVEDD